MFVICDQNDVIQDIASEEINLSRGHNVPGAKLHINIGELDLQIGDTFKNGVLIKNLQKRQERFEIQQNESKIQNHIRAAAIDELKVTGDLPADFIDPRA